jgi:hypothetical protein|tara:strand:- start:66 stop:254 length:189 start_codon:yes stop_codon:yes gene_type:complete
MALVSLESLDDMRVYSQTDKSYSWSVQCHLDDETDWEELIARFEKNFEKYSTEDIEEALKIL